MTDPLWSVDTGPNGFPRRFGMRTSGRVIAHDQARILVVDDDLWMMFSRYLLSAEYKASDAVPTATEGMLLLRTANLCGRPYDLAILDVTLRLGDLYPDGCAMGRVLVREIPGTRLLFISGYDRGDLASQCPPDLPFMLKPPERQRFLARVLETLQLPPYEWRD